MKVCYPADFRDMFIKRKLGIKGDTKKFNRGGRSYWYRRNVEINARDRAKLRTGANPHNIRFRRVKQ